MDIQLVPLDVTTLPLVPGANVSNGFVPLPISKLFKASVAEPVPPLLTDTIPDTLVAVPEVFAYRAYGTD